MLRLSSGPVTVEVRSIRAADSGGVLAGNALVYPGAYPGADSIYTVERQRVEELVLLRSAAAPGTLEYQVRVTRGGGRVRQLTS